jgi:hypothetical protein
MAHESPIQAVLVSPFLLLANSEDNLDPLSGIHRIFVFVVPYEFDVMGSS